MTAHLAQDLQADMESQTTLLHLSSGLGEFYMAQSRRAYHAKEGPPERASGRLAVRLDGSPRSERLNAWVQELRQLTNAC